ncbi:hypothetical protein SAMN05216327_11424 [Dyadobacter sp. SG02]|uniref:hypothetical protein n=1 Tax=Dyadobacter sp. SG02 TaxID=1855291 RepID=UPI0008B6524D|nr:hypothetical protein [Dyadobacter sp. SG02]SEJ60982.1 hypothetical protein SAMN05216327_11424 [Dyadobacter sp. SG02]
MKTFLGYLTFAALLVLCYIEKINAEEAKSQVRGRAGRHNAAPHLPAWAERPATVARLGE